MTTSFNKNIFEELTATRKGTYVSNEDRWFNGRSYMPLYVHRVSWSDGSWRCFLKYERRVSEFSKASVLHSGFRADRHLYEIKCVSSNLSCDNLSKFTIRSKYRFFANSFSARKQSIPFSTKSKDKTTLNRIENSRNIRSFFSHGKNMAEFEPEILGFRDGENYTICINFITEMYSEKSIKLAIESLDELISFFDNKT